MGRNGRQTDKTKFKVTRIDESRNKEAITEFDNHAGQEWRHTDHAVVHDAIGFARQSESDEQHQPRHVPKDSQQPGSEARAIMASLEASGFTVEWTDSIDPVRAARWRNFWRKILSECAPEVDARFRDQPPNDGSQCGE